MINERWAKTYKTDRQALQDMIKQSEQIAKYLTIQFDNLIEMCLHYDYDSDASELTCGHPQVFKEIVPNIDCVDCLHYKTSLDDKGDDS